MLSQLSTEGSEPELSCGFRETAEWQEEGKTESKTLSSGRKQKPSGGSPELASVQPALLAFGARQHRPEQPKPGWVGPQRLGTRSAEIGPSGTVASAVGPRLGWWVSVLRSDVRPPPAPAPLLRPGRGCPCLFVSRTRESEATCLPVLQAGAPGIEEGLHAPVAGPRTMPGPCHRSAPATGVIPCPGHTHRSLLGCSHSPAVLPGRRSPLSPGSTASTRTGHLAGGSMALRRPSGLSERLVGSRHRGTFWNGEVPGVELWRPGDPGWGRGRGRAGEMAWGSESVSRICPRRRKALANGACAGQTAPRMPASCPGPMTT